LRLIILNVRLPDAEEHRVCVFANEYEKLSDVIKVKQIGVPRLQQEMVQYKSGIELAMLECRLKHGLLQQR
jgi:hypothetical protein